MAKTKNSRAGGVETPVAEDRSPKDPELVAFGCGIRELRLAAGMTQEDLAFAAGLHWTYVGQIERGERNLTYKNVLRLAVGLQVAPARLMPGDAGDDDVVDDPGPDADQLAALSLLAEGQTPQDAAKQLGISLRDFRQRVVGAQKRLGARDLATAVQRAAALGTG